MKRKTLTVISILIILVLAGCNHSNKELLTNKINEDDIDKILIVLAGGNPAYGQKSKTITNQDEIKELVDSFNNCKIDNKVKDGDIVVADTSDYYFYQGDTLIQSFAFNGNDSKRIWVDTGYYYANYEGKSPYELYGESKDEVIIVDKQLQQ